MRQKDSLPVKLARFWDDYGAQALTIIGSTAFALAGIMPGVGNKGWSWLLSELYGRIFIGATIVTILGVVASLRQTANLKDFQKTQEKVQKLEDTLAEAKGGYFYLLNYELQILFTLIGLGNNERVSVYRHEGQAFTIRGRYSPNPEHQKPGRSIYPDDQGCIGEAWRQGKAFIQDIPTQGTKAYYTAIARWNITQDVADSLRMKSRCYAGYAIHNNNGERIAVLVFESTQPFGLDNSALETRLHDGEEKRIALFLEKMHSLEPTPKYALVRGF